MIGRLFAGAACTLALAGCVADRVTLLENETGSALGAVAVLAADGSETVLDQPNTQALLRGNSPRVRTVDPAYGALLDTLPPAATRYLLTFPLGGVEILEGQRGVIDQIRAEIERRPGAQVEVAGFTDSVGSAARNDQISRERANAVAAELRKSGIEIDDGDAVGRGEDEAKAALGDDVEDESYRRVLVIIR